MRLWSPSQVRIKAISEASRHVCKQVKPAGCLGAVVFYVASVTTLLTGCIKCHHGAAKDRHCLVPWKLTKAESWRAFNAGLSLSCQSGIRIKHVWLLTGCRPKQIGLGGLVAVSLLSPNTCVCLNLHHSITNARWPQIHEKYFPQTSVWMSQSAWRSVDCSNGFNESN